MLLHTFKIQLMLFSQQEYWSGLFFREAWHATVHAVTKSHTQLGD